MKSVRKILLAIIGIALMPMALFAVPHEPSPAGGGWLELGPELPLVQTESPWFPEYPGPLTIEAWVYIDRPRSVQDMNLNLLGGSSEAVFSIVGQTDRFTCAIVSAGYEASPAIVTRGVEGGTGKI